jgi:hypothetical protein
MSLLAPAFGYVQANPDTSRQELLQYRSQIREWVKVHPFRLLAIYADPYPDRSPRFAEMITRIRDSDLGRVTLILPQPYGLGRGHAQVEKLYLIRRYQLEVIIAGDLPGRP